MNNKLFFRGIVCAVCGFVLAQVAPGIAGTPGREPGWAAVILFALLLGWAGFTISAYLVGDDWERERRSRERRSFAPHMVVRTDASAASKPQVVIDSSAWTG